MKSVTIREFLNEDNHIEYYIENTKQNRKLTQKMSNKLGIDNYGDSNPEHAAQYSSIFLARGDGVHYCNVTCNAVILTFAFEKDSK